MSETANFTMQPWQTVLAASVDVRIDANERIVAAMRAHDTAAYVAGIALHELGARVGRQYRFN